MPEFAKNRNPILMKVTKGGPIHKNYTSPVRKSKLRSIWEGVKTAVKQSSTQGAVESTKAGIREYKRARKAK